MTSTYQAWIDNEVRNGLRDRQCSTFNELLARLRGAFPTEVRASLQQLDGVLPIEVRKWLLPPLDEPVPHPADADWRFDGATRSMLANMIAARTPGSVALLGCPSLVRSLTALAPDTDVVLLDSNPLWESHFRGCPRVQSVAGDVATAPQCHAQYLVVDPPWYPSEMERFLRVAAHIGVPGAVVLLSVPGSGTRPGIQEWWTSLVPRAGSFGLQLVDFSPGMLRYGTPWFEAQALLAAGFPPLGNWRIGDLAEFRVTTNESVPTDNSAPLVAARWRRIEGRKSGLRVLSSGTGSSEVDPRLVSIIEGDVLPSVSRRDPIHQLVRVWTTGNRVFGCLDSDLLFCALQARALDQDVVDAATRHLGRSISAREAEWLRDALGKAAAVDELEREEYDVWADAGVPDAHL